MVTQRGLVMNSQTRREIRLGLIALALSGLLLTIGIALRGPIDLADPGSLIRDAGSPNYVPAWTLILVSVVLTLYGFFGLYRYLTYQAASLIAFLAFLLRTAGIALFLPLVTFLAVNGPLIAELYQQGNPALITVVWPNLASPLGLALLGVAGVASATAMVLFAIAIWRDGRLPRWTGVLLALSWPLVAFPVSFGTELSGAVLWLISASVMAWRGWQESEAGGQQNRTTAGM